MKTPIYLDYMATTPVDPRVKEKMLQYLSIDGDFGNPTSYSHAFGWRAREAVELARTEVANLINAQSTEIIWTSGATEANNLALKGTANMYYRKGKHIITCQTEHKTVLETCKYLANKGFSISYLAPQKNGLIDLEQLQTTIRKDTILVSIMLVNNEIGVVQDIAKIAELIKPHGIIFHVDAAQAAGKIPIDLQKITVDLMSFSAHKIYGPKGVGALYVRSKPKIRLLPEMHGGGQEFGLRSGTLPTHQIAGMGEAFRLAQLEMSADNQKIAVLRNVLWDGIKTLENVYLNGDWHNRIPHNLNVSFAGIDKDLLPEFSDLALSNGAACNSSNIESSYVLRALGINDKLALSSVRFSLGRFTTKNEIDYAIEYVKKKIYTLRAKL